MKKRILSVLLTAAMTAAIVPSYAENDYAATEQGGEMTQAPEMYEARRITADGSNPYTITEQSEEINDNIVDGINTDFPADMEMPEIIELSEPIDVNFEIKPSLIRLFGTEKDLFDCGTDYAYQDFAKRSNSENRQAFYNELLAINKAFSTDYQDVPETEYGYVISEVDISVYNFTQNEATEVYFCFIMDHPEYYWLHVGNFVMYGTQTAYVTIYDDFASGSKRAELKNTMTKSIEKYLLSSGYNRTAWTIAQSLYFEIIENTDYGYDENGEPLGNDCSYAHNIVGVLDGDASTNVVCEGYARTYQLLLNYFDIDNILISGRYDDADAPNGYVEHEWNLVRLDDGKYYQVDVTWGENKYYFAVDESYWTDRTIHNSSEEGCYFLYDLPEISTEEALCPNDLKWIEYRDDMTIEVYISGYEEERNEACVFINTFGTVIDVPETVTNEGKTYTVTSFQNFCSTNVKEIHVPDSVRRIYGGYDDSLEKINIPKNVLSFGFGSSPHLNTVELSEENPYYIMEDGAIYTKDKSQLYFRLRNAEGDVFTVPDSVYEIDDCALNNNVNLKTVILNDKVEHLGNLLYGCKNLTEVTIPEGVTSIGPGFIEGTQVKKLYLPSTIVNMGGMLEAKSLEEISVSENNKNGFVSYGGALYRAYSSSMDRIVWTEHLDLLVYPNSKKDEDYHVPGGAISFNTSQSADNEYYFENFFKIKNPYLKNLYLPASFGEFLANGFCDNSGKKYMKESFLARYLEDTNIENVYIDGENPYMLDKGGVVYSKDMTKLVMYPPGREAADFTVPDSVTEIDPYAFSNAEPKNIYLGSNVKKIGDYAFRLNGENLYNQRVNIYYAGSQDEWNEIEIGDNNYFENMTVHYNSIMPTPAPTPLPTTTAAITKSETDTTYDFEVTPETSYENCYVYAAIYDADGILLSVNRVPLKTEGSTSISVNKSETDTLAKVFIFADTLQPIVETAEEFPLI